jgi:hypothetical protein
MFAFVTDLQTDAQSSISEVVYSIPVTALTGTMLGVIAFVEIGLLSLSWFVYKEIGWQIYHGRFIQHQVCCCQ